MYHVQKINMGKTIILLYKCAFRFSNFGFRNKTIIAHSAEKAVNGRKKIKLNTKLWGAYPGSIPNNSKRNLLTMSTIINNPIARIGKI